MTILVPFDGSPLSETALVRASAMGRVLDEPVLAVTVIPQSGRQARDRGWIGSDDDFTLGNVARALAERVTEIAPEVEFDFVPTDGYAPPGSIANEIRAVARDRDASLVVVGSENAGRVASTVSSVGSTVASSPTYDVLIVRQNRSAQIEALREMSPIEESVFFDED